MISSREESGVFDVGEVGDWGGLTPSLEGDFLAGPLPLLLAAGGLRVCAQETV